MGKVRGWGKTKSREWGTYGDGEKLKVGEGDGDGDGEFPVPVTALVEMQASFGFS
jgi:hypothetical protein